VYISGADTAVKVAVYSRYGDDEEILQRSIFETHYSICSRTAICLEK